VPYRKDDLDAGCRALGLRAALTSTDRFVYPVVARDASALMVVA